MSKSEQLIKKRNVQDSKRHLFLLATHHRNMVPERLKKRLGKILKEKKEEQGVTEKKGEASKPKEESSLVYKRVQATGPQNRKITTVEIQGPPYKSHEQVLKDIVSEDVPLPSHLIPGEVNNLIIRAVAEKHGVPPWEIFGRNRRREVIKARFEVMYIMRTKAYRTFPQIGKTLGFDHTSVIHGCRRHLEIRKQEAA